MQEKKSIKMNKKKITVGIIGGRGRLGTIFKKFFIKNGCNVLISGRTTKLTYKDLVRKSDVVVFSVPIHATPSIIKEVLPYTRKEQLLMDFTSIKEGPIKEMLKSEAAVIGLHPMFGKIESLKGKTIIIVPARPRKWMNWLVPLLKKGQINVKITDARKHDEIMAILQGLIHFNFISLSYTLGEISKKNKVRINDLLDYGGVIYRLRLGMIARVLSQDPGLYEDIAMLNKNSNKLFKEYEKTAKKLKEIIREKDKKEFERIFKEASKFFGGFRKQALKESNFLIEQLLEYSNKNKKTRK